MSIFLGICGVIGIVALIMTLGALIGGAKGAVLALIGLLASIETLVLGGLAWVCFDMKVPYFGWLFVFFLVVGLALLMIQAIGNAQD